MMRCAAQVASTLSSTFYSMFFLFSGFLQPKSAIPPWWIWCAPLSACAKTCSLQYRPQ